MICLQKFTTAALALVVLFINAHQSMAHFTWIATDDQGHALLFFSEGPHERDYHVPDAVASAEVTAIDAQGKTTTVQFTDVDEDQYVGRRSESADFAESRLAANFKYGIYGDTLLSYYANHVPTKQGERSQHERPRLDVDVKQVHEGVELTIYWDGQPLADAGVSLANGEEDAPRVKTDKAGKVTFNSLEEGLVGFLVGHVLKDAAGNFEGKEYTSESHYLTVTYHYKKSAGHHAHHHAHRDGHHHGHGHHHDQSEAEKPAVKVESALPELPEAVASFGSAVRGDWLYVYSGHTGTAHDHSKENLSQNFRRVRLDGEGQWEELPMQTPLQGLPLVAHGDYLYRVGGLHALNDPDDEEDLHSVDEFCRFDPESQEWEALQPLPAARSSHDAVVIGDKLYVVGGWTLSGSSPGDWLETALVCDLSAKTMEWKVLPSPPTKRRAIATAVWGDKLVVLGGMDADGEISNLVEVFDPATGEWTQVAEYPGGAMAGFGMSAWGMEGTVYASGWDGVLYKLSDDGKQWDEVEKLQLPRFFHRLMPSANGSILVVAGATEQGHVGLIEAVEVR